MVNYKVQNNTLKLIKKDNIEKHSLFDLRFYIPKEYKNNKCYLVLKSNFAEDIIPLQEIESKNEYIVYMVMSGQRIRISSGECSIMVIITDFDNNKNVITNINTLEIDVEYYSLTRQIFLVEELSVDIKNTYFKMVELVQSLLKEGENRI